MSVRGYADWKPKGDAAYWVNSANEVMTIDVERVR